MKWLIGLNQNGKSLNRARKSNSYFARQDNALVLYPMGESHNKLLEMGFCLTNVPQLKR